MPYCPKCLVGLAPNAERCPLCGEAPVDAPPERREGILPAVDERTPFSAEIRNAEEREKLSPADMRKIGVELLSVSIGIVLAVTLAFDVFFMRGITWSRYTFIIFSMLWIYTAVPLILWKRPWLVFAALGPSTILAVMLCFLFAGNMGGFLVLGLPVTVLAEATVVTASLLTAIQKHKGLNTVGIILAAIGFSCLLLDLELSLVATGGFDPSWSLVVVFSAIPVAGFFFYLHYRVMKRATLRKIFRL